jgi:hypothetical protein
VCCAFAGNLERLQQALREAGTDALAALQANTYRLPSARLTEECWNQQLQQIAASSASHPTSSFAYFSVTQIGL